MVDNTNTNLQLQLIMVNSEKYNHSTYMYLVRTKNSYVGNNCPTTLWFYQVHIITLCTSSSISKQETSEVWGLATGNVHNYKVNHSAYPKVSSGRYPDTDKLATCRMQTIKAGRHPSEPHIEEQYRTDHSNNITNASE